MTMPGSSNVGWCSRHGQYLGLTCPQCQWNSGGGPAPQPDAGGLEFRVGLLESEIKILRALVARLLDEKEHVAQTDSGEAS